jgi:hypothetical protein
MKMVLAMLPAFVVLWGCSHSSVTPVTSAAVQHGSPTSAEPAGRAKRICIVENPRVMNREFIDAYKDALEKKGYAVTVVQRNPQPSQCPLTTRYTAAGAFDGALFRLEVYRDGKPAGAATHRGFYSEASLRELVNKLLP